jgi:putative heme iron utilization protein
VHAERCRALTARAGSATLSTIAREPEGFPFGSLVAVAFDDEGAPLLLLSRLAEHTQNLAAREQASILVVEPAPDGADPLATGRLSIVGSCRAIPADGAEAARARFLARHPEAEPYSRFSDFAMYRLEPAAIRYVGGFGRMSWVDVEGYRRARAE